MPELPEVEALAEHLREHGLGRSVARVDVVSLSALKTFDPPATALVGRAVTRVARHGKYLDLDCDGVHLVVHLARAGWLRWIDRPGATPPRPGRGPLAMRAHLGTPGAAPAFDLTEAGTKKGLAVWVVTEITAIPGIARLGPDAMAVGFDELSGLLAGRTERLKTVLTEQSSIAGVGNAYSDEILHAARLSPYATAGKLGEEAVRRLALAMRSVLTGALERSVGLQAARLKGEKRSGLAVHGRTGLPCPVCWDTVREVSFAEKSLQYCPTCQTGGRTLADRRLSRLLK